MTKSTDQIRPRKLGLLAGTFEDGSMSIYVVPDPRDVTPNDHDTSEPVFSVFIFLSFLYQRPLVTNFSVKMSQPLLRIELEETACLTLDWANSEMIAVGCSNGMILFLTLYVCLHSMHNILGSIAVYNIRESLQKPSSPGGPAPSKWYIFNFLSSFLNFGFTDLVPTHYLSIHQSAIRTLAWIRSPPWSSSREPSTNENPTVIASGGYDGVECLWDIREMGGNVMNRTRGLYCIVCYLWWL